METNQTCILSFYNLKAKMLIGGVMREEKIAIKNIIKTGGNVVVDVYFHRTKQSAIIDAVYIKSVIDLNTEKKYLTPEEFIEDLKTEQQKRHDELEIAATEKSGGDLKYLKDLHDDLIILSFLARCSWELSSVKNSVIRDYIRKRKPQAEVLSEQYISTYLANLDANEKSFYQALNNLSYKSVSDATELLKESIKIASTDGVFTYYEKRYIAEIMQTFREHGVNPNVEF